MKILVCEDNPMTLRAIEFTLTGQGYEVIRAEDGNRAIEILQSDGMDLVITDINMPYTKGLELLRYINTSMEKRIPVIIVSVINLEETMQHAEELGASGYLTKPFDPQVLIEMVQSLIGK